MVEKLNFPLQYGAALCVNIVSLSCGNFGGWPSASFLVLQSEESPLVTGPLSNDTGGWIVAMYGLGGCVGALTSKWLAEKTSLKRTLQFSAIPIFLAWALIPIATHPIYLFLSRFLGGYSSGVLFNLVPIYIVELADDSIRGTLGTFITFAFNIGMEIAFILGYFFHHETVAWINLPLPIIFLILFSLIPETPRQLVLKNKTEEAEMSLRYFRNIRETSIELPESYKFELEKLKTEQTTQEADDTALSSWKDIFTEPKALKALNISIGLFVLNVMSGSFALVSYTGTIFQQAGSNLSPNLAAIVVGIILVLGSYTATIFVDRAGRKILLVISSFGSAIGLLALGGYVYLSSLGFNLDSFAWLPLASFAFTIFLATFGMATIPYVVISEILPPKIRDQGVMLGMFILWFLSFVVLKITPMMTDSFGMHGTMFIFSTFCLFGTIFIMVCLPETKGRSIEEILLLL